MSQGAHRRATRTPRGARIVGFAVGTDFWLGTTLVRVVRVADADKLLVRHLATQHLEHVSSGIDLDYRPVATPRLGGAIERMIGTLMGKVKLLPGATDSRILGGRPKKTETNWSAMSVNRRVGVQVMSACAAMRR